MSDHLPEHLDALICDLREPLGNSPQMDAERKLRTILVAAQALTDATEGRAMQAHPDVFKTLQQLAETLADD